MSDDGIETAKIACEPCRHKKCKVGVVFPRLTLQPSEFQRACPEVTDDRIHPGSVIASYPPVHNAPVQSRTVSTQKKNRRGIPAGYVNALEKRLAETEKALFSVLAEARAGTHSNTASQVALRPSVLSRSTPTTQQEKAELMTLWNKTPLEGRAHVEAWFEANRGEGASPVSVDVDQTRVVREFDAVAPVTPPTDGPTNISNLAAQSHHNAQLEGPVSAPAGEGQSHQSGSPRLSMRAQRAPRLSRHSPLSRGSTIPGPSLPQTSRANRFANDNKRLYF